MFPCLSGDQVRVRDGAEMVNRSIIPSRVGMTGIDRPSVRREISPLRRGNAILALNGPKCTARARRPRMVAFRFGSGAGGACFLAERISADLGSGEGQEPIGGRVVGLGHDSSEEENEGDSSGRFDRECECAGEGRGLSVHNAMSCSCSCSCFCFVCCCLLRVDRVP
jgi:hypothetical protein